MPAYRTCIGDHCDGVSGWWGLIRASVRVFSAILPDDLRTEQFDLVVVSAWLEEWEWEQTLAAAGKTPVLVLTELMLADDLLAQVERQLVAAAQDPAKERPVKISNDDWRCDNQHKPPQPLLAK
jgi:hypothetical protein